MELDKDLRETMVIRPEYLKLIMSGQKKFEFRSWLSNATEFSLINEDTGKIAAVIKIDDVMDMNELTDEDKDAVLDEGKVTQEFREQYDCRFCYMIKSTHWVH